MAGENQDTETESFPAGTSEPGLDATCKQRIDSGIAVSCVWKKLQDDTYLMTTVWKAPPP